jgi:hypothetical protein
MKRQPTPATWVILGGAVVMLLGSFLDFYKVDAFGFSDSYNAWSGDLYFPLSLIPVLCALAMAAHVALTTFADVKFPDGVLGLGWNQIHLALGFQAALMMIFWIFVEKFGYDLGIGFWLMLISGIALAVGAVLRQQEAPATAL